MTITLKSHASVGTTISTWQVNSAETIATAIGDLVMCIHVNNFYAFSNIFDPTPGGGETPVAISGGAIDGGPGQPGSIKSWYYYAAASGLQQISFDEGGTSDEEKAGYVLVFGGAASSSPIDDAQGSLQTVSSSTNLSPSVTPATSDAYVVSVVSNAVGKTYTAPGSLTEVEEQDIGAFLGAAVGVAQLSASGATGTYSWTPSASCPYVAVTVALKTAVVAQDATVTLLPTQASVSIHP